MSRTMRSGLGAGGTFFAAAITVLAMVSARPGHASGLQAGTCPGQKGDGPLCMIIVSPQYCEDDEGNVYECGEVSEYWYLDREDSQG